MAASPRLALRPLRSRWRNLNFATRTFRTRAPDPLPAERTQRGPQTLGGGPDPAAYPQKPGPRNQVSTPSGAEGGAWTCRWPPPPPTPARRPHLTSSFSCLFSLW